MVIVGFVFLQELTAVNKFTSAAVDLLTDVFVGIYS